MSFLIRNNIAIATTIDRLKSGTVVYYSYQSTTEVLNANVDKVLVNSEAATISNAKKYVKTLDVPLAVVLDKHNPFDFLLVDQ